MSYYFSKTLNTPFDEAIILTTEALKKEGFGVVSEINFHDKMKQAMGITFRKYMILGACNPAIAYEALTVEDKIGTMLPCNVIVQELESGKVEVAAVNPMASMQAIQNPGLAEIAKLVTTKMENVIGSL